MDAYPAYEYILHRGKGVKYYFFAKLCFFTAAGEEDDDGVLFAWTLGGSGFGGGVFLALLSSFFSPPPPVEGSFPLKMSSQSGNSLDEGIGASGEDVRKSLHLTGISRSSVKLELMGPIITHRLPFTQEISVV